MREVIFLDIDGTLTRHMANDWPQYWEEFHARGEYLLPGVKAKLDKWNEQGYQIILTTGRKESQRKETEKQLALYGLKYERLYMDIGHGCRHIINDEKTSTEEYPVGISCYA